MTEQDSPEEKIDSCWLCDGNNKVWDAEQLEYVACPECYEVKHLLQNASK